MNTLSKKMQFKKHLPINLFAGVLTLISTSAFADVSQPKSDQRFSAFIGVQTSLVSPAEADKVSGEMAPIVYAVGSYVIRSVAANLIANKVTCGKFKGCSAR